MLLNVSNLTVCYDKAMIINDISLHVNQGDLVSLVGPNGAGKSTLLRAVTGLVIWEKGIHRGTSAGDITLDLSSPRVLAAVSFLLGVLPWGAWDAIQRAAGRLTGQVS